MSSPAREDPGAALERFAPALMRWGSRSDVRRAMLGSAGSGEALSPTDEWLLGRVVDVGPVRVSELATWQSVDRSTMTSQVHHLEAAGLVSRAVDASDRRASLVSATAEGRRRHLGIVERYREVLGRLVEDWPEADRSDLARLVDRLTRSLEHHPPTR